MVAAATPPGDLIHPRAAAFRIDGSNGEAFVLVHGFTGNAAHFRHLGGQLADRGYTVNAPLLPGHGRSIGDLARVRRSDWVDATVDAIREVGDHRRVHVVGLSMGGLLGVIAATRAPVATLTTINAPIRFQNWRIRFARVARLYQRELRWPESPPPKLDPEVAPHWIHLDGFPMIAAAELFTLSRRALQAAPQVTCPGLVIQSKVDDTSHPASGRKLRRALGNDTRLLWLEHSMHNALFDTERDVIRDAIMTLTQS
ncbi:MAG: alpha/beta fold hydrolase [Acidimicrobiia bacterium]